MAVRRHENMYTTKNGYGEQTSTPITLSLDVASLQILNINFYFLVREMGDSS